MIDQIKINYWNRQYLSPVEPAPLNERADLYKDRVRKKLEKVQATTFSDLIRTDYSLLAKGGSIYPDRAHRACLRCHVTFLSQSKGNRLCGSCAAQNRRSSARAEDILI